MKTIKCIIGKSLLKSMNLCDFIETYIVGTAIQVSTRITADGESVAITQNENNDKLNNENHIFTMNSFRLV